MQDIAKYPVMKHIYGNLIRSRKLSYVPKINARHMSNVPKMCRAFLLCRFDGFDVFEIVFAQPSTFPAPTSPHHSLSCLYPTAFSPTFTYINRMLSIPSHFHYDISVDMLNNVL